MNEILLFIWILFWIIFLILSFIEKRGVVFGFMSGIWILFLGVYIYVDGVQLQTGMNVTNTPTQHIVEYVYSEIIPPFNTYGIL